MTEVSHAASRAPGLSIVTDVRPPMESASAIERLGEIRWDDLPPAVIKQAQLCVLDLLGVAAAGLDTEQAKAVRRLVGRRTPVSAGTRLWFDGSTVDAPSAAWANSTAIESFDAHDGHSLTKGHAGVAILPAVLAVVESRGIAATGQQFLRSVILGYEVAIRCGIGLQATALEYHSSGAWNSIGVAVTCAELVGLSRDCISHAAGIAEYWAPRGLMMRCIARPTMVKDSSAWGARVGTEAVELAELGFSGAPSELLDGIAFERGPQGPPAEAIRHLWTDLGQRWRISELYFKPIPICRWAQPAVEGVLKLRAELTEFAPDDVEQVEIRTFREAVALGTRWPRNTEEAQYSLSYACAAALVRGRLGPEEVMREGLEDPSIRAIAERITTRNLDAYDERFPEERLADVTMRLRDGRVFEATGMTPRGEASFPLSLEEILEKFRTYATSALGASRATAIEDVVFSLAEHGCSAEQLSQLLWAPPGEG